jgi:hypothetical protein
VFVNEQTLTIAFFALAGCGCLLLGIALGYRHGKRAALFARHMEWEHLPTELWLGGSDWSILPGSVEGGHRPQVVRWTQYGARLVGRIENDGRPTLLLEGLVCGNSVSCLLVDPVDRGTVLGTWMLSADDDARRLRGHECRRLPESTALVIGPLSLRRFAGDADPNADHERVALPPVNV